MERQKILTQEPKNLSPCSSGRRNASSYASSPEFEFWMVGNPSCPQPDILSADELFSNGVVLPLDLLPSKQLDPNPPPEPDPPEPEREPSFPSRELESGASIKAEPATPLSTSKRWRDIFRKEKGKTRTTKSQEEKERKEKKKGQSQNGASSAELNINIWPFSRSRSAGNSVTRPRMFSGAPVARKVSSAPCSRSNSAGESKSRVKWPSSPGRPGVHLGRSSPVWQVRRTSLGAKSPETVARMGDKGGSKKEFTEPRRSKIGGGGTEKVAKAKVLNVNVPMCIGYKTHLSCRSDENGAIAKGLRSGSCGRTSGTNANHVGGSGNHFSLRNLFTKKVY